MADLFGEGPGEEDGWTERMRNSSRDANRRPLGGNTVASIQKVEHLAHELETRPLAERMRPQTFEDYLGQEALLGEKAPLRQLIETDRLPSIMLWGPPGSGKTTLARLIAQKVKSDFVTLSAVTASIRDIRAVIDQAKVNRKFQRRTILFIDEIHRFNKAQQDGFLPHVESGEITLIGATTENPSFSVIAPLLSRCRIFVLKSMDEADVMKLLARGLERLNSEEAARGNSTEVSAEEEALQAIIRLSDGDARRALGLLEVTASVKRAQANPTPITGAEVAAMSQRQLIYDKTGEEHYNLISALHKTIRSSDPHGAVYWLGRMLQAGEDPLFIARRLVRMASEDIGLADPFALNHAMECLRTYQLLGTPEGELALAQCAIYLAMAPKSNAVYTAYNQVKAEVEKSGSLPVPLPIRNAPSKLMKDLDYGAGYTYDHDAPGHFAPKQGLPDALQGTRFYEPTDQGRERANRERLATLDAARDAIIASDASDTDEKPGTGDGV